MRPWVNSNLGPEMKHKSFKFYRNQAEMFTMGMLDRYKKSGGFHQLLVLIETSGPKKQEQFLSLIEQENPAWKKELKSKILTIDRVFSWPTDVMFEVLTRIQPLTLCATLQGKTPEEVDRILTPLPPITRRKLVDQLAELKHNAGEKFTAEMRLVSEVRGIAASGHIKFEKFDPNLCIEENIEEILNNADHRMGIDLHKPEEPPKMENSSPKIALHEVTSDAAPVAAGSVTVEFEALKKKLTSLAQENSALKHENQILKDKLLQIRKIA
jgi:hypothetical protein